jgi:hypothetical protein
VEIHVHVHFAEDDPDRVLRQVMDTLNRMEARMSKKLDELEAAVAKTLEVEASAVTLIRGLAQQIQDAGTDANKLNELRDTLLAKAADLGAAVAANTPADPAPPVETPPVEPPAQP